MNFGRVENTPTEHGWSGDGPKVDKKRFFLLPGLLLLFSLAFFLSDEGLSVDQPLTDSPFVTDWSFVYWPFSSPSVFTLVKSRFSAGPLPLLLSIPIGSGLDTSPRSNYSLPFFSCVSPLSSMEDTVLAIPELIVGSLSGSRQKSVRFLVGESSVPVTSSVSVQIIKINH